MIELIEDTNFYLALGGVVTLLGAAILVFDFLTSRSLEVMVRTYGLAIAFFVTTGGTISALVYSEYFGFIPCGLCWLQRIFLFPQVFMLAGAIFYKDTLYARYGIMLSVTGLIIGLYQHYLQMGGSELVRCPVAGVGSDCAKRFMFEFGFITFPLLSAIAFLFLTVLYVYILKTRTA
jgi:disulfide bond formation protein DsbB